MPFFGDYKCTSKCKEALKDRILILRNVAVDWTENDVKSALDQFGRIFSLSLPRDEDGRSKRVAFCQMESRQACQDVLAGFAAQRKTDAPEKSSIYAEFADVKEFKQNIAHEIRTVYISNLEEDVTEKEMEKVLSKYGNVRQTKVLRDKSNQSKGVGFCKMYTNEDCLTIIYGLNGFTFPGRSAALKVRFADYRKRRSVSTKDSSKENTSLYVGKLPPTANPDVLDHLFSQMGKVISIKLIRRDDGSCRGYAFCKMRSKWDCEKVIEAFNGYALLSVDLHKEFYSPIVVEYARKGTLSATSTDDPGSINSDEISSIELVSSRSISPVSFEADEAAAKDDVDGASDLEEDDEKWHLREGTQFSHIKQSKLQILMEHLNLKTTADQLYTSGVVTGEEFDLLSLPEELVNPIKKEQCLIQLFEILMEKDQGYWMFLNALMSTKQRRIVSMLHYPGLLQVCVKTDQLSPQAQNEVLHKTKQLLLSHGYDSHLRTELAKLGITTFAVLKGSIILWFRCPSSKSLDAIWQLHNEGKLKVLLNDGIRPSRVSPGSRTNLPVEITEEDYELCKDELEKLECIAYLEWKSNLNQKKDLIMDQMINALVIEDMWSSGALTKRKKKKVPTANMS